MTVASAAAKVENCTIVDNTLDGGCCASAGLRLSAADDVDLLGNPRLRKGATIDMGCYQATLQG